MPNVIKARQLDNGEKLTPKSDFVYHSISTNEVKIYEINGNVKGSYRNSLTAPIRVGKGQIIDFQGAAPNLSMCLVDGNGTQLNSLTIDTNWDGIYHTTKNIITFLGTPFKSRGDNDRYIMVTQSVTTDNGKYYPSLFNIDKWEWKNPRTGAGYSIYYDMAFDGVDTVYVCYNEQRIQVAKILEWYDGTATSVVELLDNAGSQVEATRIYGIDSDTEGYARIVLRTTTDGIRVFDLQAETLGGTLQLGANGTAAMCPAGEEIKDFNQSQSYVMSTDSGTLLMKRSNTKQIQLDTRTKEKVLRVIYFKHTPNVETEIVLAMVNTDNWNRFTRKFKIDWTAGYGDLGVVTNELLGTQVFGGPEWVNDNEIANSTNSYDIGKFYDYGLQVKWNNR